jgi:four helix bundle protein
MKSSIRVLQSAAASAMGNIAEGLVRRSNKEFLQYLFIAMSSSAEVRSHLYIAVNQGYLSKDSFKSVYAQALPPLSGLFSWNISCALFQGAM